MDYIIELQSNLMIRHVPVGEEFFEEEFDGGDDDENNISEDDIGRCPLCQHFGPLRNKYFCKLGGTDRLRKSKDDDEDDDDNDNYNRPHTQPIEPLITFPTKWLTK